MGHASSEFSVCVEDSEESDLQNNDEESDQGLEIEDIYKDI